MSTYTIITGTKPNGSLAITDGKNMTVKEAVTISREWLEQGITDVTAKTGYPIRCPKCHILVDVDRDLEGFEKYCKPCETEVRNQLYFDKHPQFLSEEFFNSIL